MSTFFPYENCENWVTKQTIYVIFLKICHGCPTIKNPHIVHLTIQHWMNQISPCIYRSNP
jgi:hypothetical protein